MLGGLLLARYLWPVSAATRAGWIADLDRLEAHTAAAYANLGDRLTSRNLSPRALDTQARAALAAARSPGAARAALIAFVEAFDDHHFTAAAPYSAPRRWLRRLIGKDRRQEEGPISRSLSGTQACAHFGARDRRFGKVDWSALPGYTPLAADPVSHPFPAGLLRRDGAASLGILRIGLFSQQGFPALCSAEWERLQRASYPDNLCDETCQDDFWAGLEERLLDRFAAELEELAAGGASALLVDLSDNGGGSGIVGRMMRMVTSRPLPERAAGFIRHPHSVARFTSMAADYAAEAARPELPARQRELYARLEAQLTRRRAKPRHRATSRECGSSRARRSCRARTSAASSPGSTRPSWLSSRSSRRSRPASESGASGGGAKPSRPAAWTGELFVLTNRRTASASEDFAASLQDAGAATIVGAATMGIGCGYTNGGVTLELPATGLTVRAPDCIRYRQDGGTKPSGVSPLAPPASMSKKREPPDRRCRRSRDRRRTHQQASETGTVSNGVVPAVEQPAESVEGEGPDVDGRDGRLGRELERRVETHRTSESSPSSRTAAIATRPSLPMASAPETESSASPVSISMSPPPGNVGSRSPSEAKRTSTVSRSPLASGSKKER